MQATLFARSAPVCAQSCNSRGLNPSVHEEGKGLMRTRRLALSVLVSLCSIAGGAALWSAPTLAATGHPFLSSFGSFGAVRGIAVSEATGDVYVYDGADESVKKFNAAGEPVNFSALGGNEIAGVGVREPGESEIAVDNSSGPASGDIYVASGFRVGIYAPDGSSLGELSEAVQSEVPGAPWGEACGVAVDATGHVYVGLYGESVNKYTPAANPAKNTDYTSSLMGLSSVCNIAADSAGSVYVDSFAQGPVNKYEALQFGSLTASGSVLDEAGSTLAVDPTTDDVYVDEGGQVSQYDSLGNLLGNLGIVGSGAISGSFGVGVNGASGKVYVSNNSSGHVNIYGSGVTVPDVSTGTPGNPTTSAVAVSGTVNPEGIPASCEFEYGPYVAHEQGEEGAQVETFDGYTAATACATSPGAGTSPVEVAAQLSGLTPNTRYRVRLLATNANGSNAGQPVELTTTSPPVVDDELALDVGYTGATVQAQVNPMGYAATYHFEYGTSTAYGASAPTPDGAIPAGSSDQGISRIISGLQPGTTYHFRVVASSANGITDGPDHTFRTYASTESVSDSCANAQIRQTQFSSYLPDCRAYEQVSPVEKGVGGANVTAAHTGMTQSSLDGNAIKYISVIAYGDAQGVNGRGEEYASSRTTDGWTSHAITPRQESVTYGIVISSQYQAFSDDLSKGVFLGYKPIIDGHPNVAHVTNLYLRTDVLSGPPGSYGLLSDSAQPLPPQTGFAPPAEIKFVSASADFSHILFESLHNLTPQASGFDPTVPKLYLWVNGTLSLAGVLPGGGLAPESMPGRGSAVFGNSSGFSGRGTISTDGSRYVFLAGPFETEQHANIVENYGNLYLRDHEETILLNVSERSTPDPHGHQGAIFRGATPDDSKVFFSSHELLTNDATGASASAKNADNLYRYDMNAPAGHHITLISVDHEPSDDTAGSCECGGSRGEYVALDGISEDGSYVYFLSGNKLVPGQRDFRGEELDVWHDGTVRAITETDQPPFGENEIDRADAFRISDSGRYVVFPGTRESTARQAGVALHHTTQLFLYDYETQKLTCASCNPSGSAPAHNAGFEEESDSGLAVGFASYLTRPFSRDGRELFFDTDDALVPQDTNGRRDVYEFELETGSLHLISAGTSAYDSTFVDASADGSNVFFTTHQQLVHADSDTAADLYDARVNGGIPVQNQAPVAACEGDDCQGPASGAAGFSLPASSTFDGAGNPRRPASVPVKPKTRALTVAQKLARALKVCNKKPKRKRAVCRTQARKRYKVHKASKTAHRAVKPVHTSHRAGR